MLSACPKVWQAPLAVGQSIGLIKETKSCREVVEGMVAEAADIFARMR
jgi:NAD(P)H-dependent flavin oxidoreductase YrpB (nitropropane dioxygenase family)